MVNDPFIKPKTKNRYINCMTMSFNKEYMAIGYNNGEVVIVNT